ncbi:pilus assembly protein [Rheinheimera soli]|uniref:pilus assembly protein n=1 Tax=Rheinheimera soli TaxID=443616 RepID=UPI001E5DDAA9|nr:PilC/PilY family type IV pilus protein [Rheinheimera soli]
MKLQTSCTKSMALSLMLTSFYSAAALDLTSPPLQTGSSVEPNIMFMIDDSGSMHWEITPDLYADNPHYVYPIVAGIYGDADATHQVVSFRDESNATNLNATNNNEALYARAMRSYALNKSYYNPSITYKPWIKADGTSYPNSNPVAAYHHPFRTFKGSRNLTVNETSSAGWRYCTITATTKSNCQNVTASRTFYPAVYYNHTGGSLFTYTNYQRIEINAATLSYSGEGRINRTDCTAGTCSYAQEMQNFANWYTYYRSRLLASQAGIGRAFSTQTEALRVGFGAINKGSSTVDGVSVSTIINGVRPFTGNAKQNFYDQLYERVYDYNGTPLRKALNDAGLYYSRTDNKGPWGENPGSDDGSQHIMCRQSYSILMTDGYWSEDSASQAQTAAARSNNDGSTTNNQNISKPGGTSYVYAPAGPFSDNRSNTLADVAMYYWKRDLRTDLDNLVPTSPINPAFWQHMVTFGVGLGVEGTISSTTAFNAIGSASAISWPDPLATQPAKIDDLLHAAVNSRGGFFSAADPDAFATGLSNTLSAIIARVASGSNLAGTTTSLQAEQSVYQGRFNSGDWSGDLVNYNIEDTTSYVWSAAEEMPDWDDRVIYFGKTETTADLFVWANLTSGVGSQQAALGSSNVVDYLRGNPALEQQNGGGYRNRSTALGDIANSSPVYVGAPVNFNYHAYSWPEASSYKAHIAAYKNRQPLIYVGANDGMLHAFNATTGAEAFAYVPKQMLTAATNLKALSEPNVSGVIQKDYFVDGTAVSADVYFDGSWRTVLVGSTGRGGNSLFALDITNPGQISEASLLWDKSFPQLGITTAKPVITRLNNGKWAVVIGYGYNNSTGRPGLLVLDIETGVVMAGGNDLEVTTGSGDTGLGQIEGWDYSKNGNTDWFFAGDLQGNVWKFDLSSNNPGNWAIAYGGEPLYQAEDAAGDPQSITGGIALGSEPKTGKLWLFFGTGRYLETPDPQLDDEQSWYGIMDGTALSGRTLLKERILTNVSHSNGTEGRTISPSAPNDMAGFQGWFIDLPDVRERIVSSPRLVGTTLVVNSIIPDSNVCNPEGDGYVMAIDPFHGGRLKYHFFDISGDEGFNQDDGVAEGDDIAELSGVRFNSMPTEPLFFEDKMAVGLADTNVVNLDVNTQIRRGRVSWREVDN